MLSAGRARSRCGNAPSCHSPHDRTADADAINDANLKGAKRFGPKGTTEMDIRDHGASGDLAFWTGYQEAQMDVDGRLVPMKLRVTEVFRKNDGEWRMVHRHASKAAAH